MSQTCDDATPGQSYCISVWVLAQADTLVEPGIRVIFFDADYYELARCEVWAGQVVDSWRKISVSGIVPTGTIYYSVWQLIENAQTGQLAYYDDFEVELGSVPETTVVYNLTGFEAGSFTQSVGGDDEYAEDTAIVTGTQSPLALSLPASEEGYLEMSVVPMRETMGCPTELYASFAVNISALGPTSPSALCSIWTDYTDAFAALTVVDATGYLQLRNRDEEVLATGSHNIADGEDHTVEFYVKPGAVGACTVKVDGTSDIAYTGALAPAFGDNTVYIIDFGYAWWYPSSCPAMTLDNIVLANNWVGPAYIAGIVPASPGTYTEFTPSAGENWECVDDAPHDEDATTIAATVDGTTDTYQFSTLGASTGIIAVRWLPAGDCSNRRMRLRRIVRIGSTDYESFDLASAYVNRSDPSFYTAPCWEVMNVSPATGDAWTVDEINDTEFGVKAVDCGESTITLTALTLEVASENPFGEGAPPTYAAMPSATLEIQWDGTNWVDETAHVVGAIAYSSGLLSGPGDLATFGLTVPAAQLTVTLDNHDGRYSVDHADSQAAVNGIYQRKIRFSAGYIIEGTPELVQVWIGRVQDIRGGEAAAQVTLICYGFEYDLAQARPETIAVEAYRTDELIDMLAGVVGFTELALEPGYVAVPWYYADADACLSEMQEIAEAEGALAWVDAKDGKLKLWTWSHWLDATSTATFSSAPGAHGIEDASDQRSWRDARDIVNVTYTPRRSGQRVLVHQLTEAIVIPPSGSTQQRFRFRQPLAKFDSYVSRATTGGGRNMDAWLEVGATTPVSATTWVTTLSNDNPDEALVLRQWDVYGYPIEGLPAKEQQLEADAPLLVSRRHDVYGGQQIKLEVRSRFCLQTEMQAELIAALKVHRLGEPPLFITIGPVPGDSALSVGDVVTVDLTTGVSTINADFVLMKRDGQYGTRWEETWLAVLLANLTEYTVTSSGSGDGYFKVGSSLLAVGRLGY
ncbi:MAG: hypothetical protein ABFD96_09825 [Armatimonadia bacterium]